MTRRLQPAAHATAVAALGALVVTGSLFVWIGVPLLVLKAIGAVTARADHVVVLALLAIPVSMVGFGWLLYRINGLYEELRGAERQPDLAHTTWLRSVSDDRRRRAPRRLIDVAMTASAWTAVVLMAIWFFAFAEMHLVS
jgi:hypothetical protein